MKILISVFLVAILLSGCLSMETKARNSIEFVNYSKNNYPSKPKDYPIDLYFEDKPQREYEVIGGFSGSVDSEDEIKPILKARAREVGGDGVIDIEASQGTETGTVIEDVPIDINTPSITTPVVNSYTYEVIKIKAKVIKYK